MGSNPLSASNQDPLNNIQERIYDAFVECNIKNSLTPLTDVENDLKQTKLKSQQGLVEYWQAYLDYYKAIYFLKHSKKKEAEKTCDQAIELLENLKNKSSEDYALLAMIQSFNIQFKGFKAMFISSKVNRNAKKAIALNPENLRAYYVYASHDFYTPARYGGGKKAEKLLLTAIDLPSQQIENAYLPSWGKVETYELLVKHYIKVEKKNEAKKFLKQGLEEFPDSYILKELATKLI